MMTDFNNVLLQKIRDDILGVTRRYYAGDLDSAVYIQEIREAILGASAHTIGDMSIHVYLQLLRDAYLGVSGTKIGNLSDDVYLRQIRDAALGIGIANSGPGDLDENVYLKEILDNGYTPPVTTPWYLSGGIVAANCRAAYQPVGADSLADSYLNLVTPGTNDAAPGVAPTWNAVDGWIFNGSTQYLTTQNAANLITSTWTTIVRYTNVVATSNRHIYGNYDGTRLRAVRFRTDLGNMYVDHGNTVTTAILNPGIFCMAGLKNYKNGVDILSDSAGWAGAMNNKPLFIGTYNNNGVPLGTGYLNCRVQAFAIYNITLTAAQVLAVTQAMQAL